MECIYYRRVAAVVVTLFCTVCIALAPAVVFAQVDSRCFTEDECRAAREGSTEGFYQARETAIACNGKTNADGDKVGFCSPNGSARTKISIGGIREFDHIGDYIQVIFRFGVAAIAVLSVVVIIASGLQWTASGGNSSIIESAKGRIKSALIGLLLVIFSVAILGRINPYLVNFRLPQIWMLNSIGLQSVYCNDDPDAKVSLTQDGQTVPAVDAQCGKTYFVNKSQNTCLGLACEDKETCAALPDGERTCKSGMLSGNVSATPEFFTKDLKGNIIDNNLELIAVCKNGRLEEIDDIDVGVNDESDEDQQYLFPYSSRIEHACQRYGDGVVGFFLGAEINDEGSGLGFAGDTFTLGIDDWHAIGKQFDSAEQTTSHSCHANLSIVAFSYLRGGGIPDCEGDNGIEHCSCAAISERGDLSLLVQEPRFTKHLISLEELKKGFSCDIHITRLAFPAISNFDPIEDDTDCFEYQ